MKPTSRYIGLAVIFLCSLLAAAFFHYFPSGVVGELASIPAISALFGALFQLSRDSIAHDRAMRLEEARNRFTVGATSHMANLAFDKHVQFCEEYTVGVYNALETLFTHGPHQEVLQDANALSDKRTKWAIWLTPEIETKLEHFESALRTIGAQAWLLAELRADENRNEAIKQAYGTFAAVMGWDEWQGLPVTKGIAAVKIIDGLRDTLGIKELTQLRTALVKRAFENLQVT
jgi:hypothetical protein